MQSGISFIVAWIVIVLLCLVYTYFLFLSLSVIARCFVSFFSGIVFLYICVYVTVLFIKEEEEEEEELDEDETCLADVSSRGLFVETQSTKLRNCAARWRKNCIGLFKYDGKSFLIVGTKVWIESIREGQKEKKERIKHLSHYQVASYVYEVKFRLLM